MADNSLMPHPWQLSTETNSEPVSPLSGARIVARMLEAGSKAAADYSEPDTGACGFATLVVFSPKMLASHLRRSGFRRSGKGLYERTIHHPRYQSLDAHEHVARAMAESLTADGVDAYARGRLD